jgi:5-methylcytosine-specific restriction endonuclease McrA
MINYVIQNEKIKFFRENGKPKSKKALNEEEIKFRKDYYESKYKEKLKKIKEERKANKLTKAQWEERQVKRKAYMRTPQWLKLKQDVLDFQNQRCGHCKVIVDLSTTDLHHMTYERLFNEEITDMKALCKKCHHNYHQAEKWLLSEC